VEVGGAGCRWSAGAAKKQVGQSLLQVTAVTVLGRDRKMVAVAGASGGWRCSQSQRSQEAEPVAGGGRRCRWQLERRSGEEAGGPEAVAGFSCDGARSG
jgi:hypothetical protein